MMNTFRTVVLVEVDDNLGIRAGVKTMTFLLELGTKDGEIVDLAVEDDPDRAIFVKDGLMSAVQIDNAKTPHTESYAIFDIYALVIRTTMHDLLAHAMNGFFIDSKCLIRACDSGNTAHWFSLSAPYWNHGHRCSAGQDGFA